MNWVSRTLPLAVLCLALAPGALWSQEHGEGSHGEGHGEEEHHSNVDAWKWANFAILAGIIGWVAMKHGGAFFGGRNQEIRKELDEAAKLKQEAEARYAAVEARLASLGSDIESLRANSRSELQAELARLAAEADAQLAKIDQQTKNQMDTALKSSRLELRAYASRLALELAEQRLRERITADTEKGLIDTFLQRLEKDIDRQPVG